MKYKKSITGNEIIEEIRQGRLSLQAIKIELDKSNMPDKNNRRIDAKIIGCWDNQKINFAAEIKTLSTPKIFMEAIAVLKEKTRSGTLVPLIICPFLSEEQLQKLENEGINGVDLCGNGAINIPGKISIFRTGYKNLFPTGGPIKNVYRKTSSLVGRTLLSCPRFDSVTQLTEEIGEKDFFAKTAGRLPLTFGTVSKCLSAMVQDLIISKDKRRIDLLQPDKLIDMLARNYTESNEDAVISTKIDLDENKLTQRLADLSVQLKVPIVATGLSSVSRYAVMEQDKKFSIYCPRSEELLDELGASKTIKRFPNLEIHETKDSTVYFDAYNEDGFCWASPIQTYLELISGDKRDRETAGQVLKYILDAVKRQSNE